MVETHSTSLISLMTTEVAKFILMNTKSNRRVITGSIPQNKNQPSPSSIENSE
ncbi:hypothetical protein Glove_441g71 [Diversispora epigaea]|uniref:Uncharacterized protein n=1 Tax=Diversispora epigaea TaxID=1348612 RepID=A0A397GRS2_9GLOM|nr:hypothetical protein Glove_441g71 [Diversispora epigaea]